MDILQMTRELAKAVQQDDRYVAHSLAMTASDNDKDLQDMIGRFNLLRLNINNEMAKGGEADQDKIKENNEEIGALYEKVMANPHMKVVAATQKDLDNLLKQINAILGGAMNGENPDTIDAEAACGGDCSSCGGCSHGE